MQRKRSCGWLVAGFVVALAFSTHASADKQKGNNNAAPAAAPHRSNYAGIVGTSREDAGKKMQKLGFKKKKDGNEDRGSLWWNGTTKECVELTGKNDRVKSIEPTSSSRCH